MKLLNLYTPSGLGDIHWTSLKLQSLQRELGCKVNLYYETNKFHSPEDLLGMLPFIDQYIEDPIVDKSKRFFIRYPHIKELFNGNKSNSYFFWAHNDLITTNDIDKVIPEVSTNYDYDICIPDKAMRTANRVVSQLGRPLVLTNASWRSIDPSQVRHFWDKGKYVSTAKLFFDHFNTRTVLLGGKYELDHARDISHNNNYFFNGISEFSLAETIALISKCDLIWGFQGGLNMIADRFKRPTIILWPIQEFTRAAYCTPKNLFNSWIRPESKATRRNTPLIFGKDATPENILKEAKRLLCPTTQKTFAAMDAR